MFLLPLALAIPVLAQAADAASFHGVLLDAAGKPVATAYPLTLKTPGANRVIMRAERAAASA
jgi:hypothetical protein